MPHPPNRLNTIRLCRGQTKDIGVEVKTKNGAVAPITGTTLFFTVKEKASDTVPLISLTSPDDIVITDGAAGEAMITIPSDQTDIEKGCYRYDIWVEYPGSPPRRFCLVKYAEFIVEDAITVFATVVP